MEKGKKKSTIKFMCEVAGRTKGKIALLVFLQALLGINSVCYALFLKEIINAAMAGEKTLFFWNIGLFALLMIFQLFLRALVRFQEEKTRASLENRWKSRLFSSLMKKDYAYVSAVHSGEWMNRLTNDTVVVANGMTEIIPGISGMLVKLVGALVLIVLLEPRFLFVLIPGGILLLLVSYGFRRKMKWLHKKVQEQDGFLRMFLQETLGSMGVVRSYGVENAMTQVAEEKMQAHKKARMRRNHFSNLCNLGFGTVMNGAYLLGAVFCGYGILTQTMSYGTFMAVLQLIGQVQAPFANLSGFLPRSYAVLASGERLMEVEKLEENERTERKSLSEIQKIYENHLETFGLDQVSFTYLPPAQTLQFEEKKQAAKDKMPMVISKKNLEILKGEFVAFTGPSGCGKSTILKLLMCLYPLDEGERYVQIDGHRECLDGSWQKLFAYVPQGNHLMSGTIREIIAFADKEQMRDEERMQQALSIACAEGFVRELEKGLDTVLGEGGLGLSEGQMQRLAIARAIFSGHPILMLDECSSALDEKTERQLLANLRAMTDRTVLIVTHRPAALEICDTILEFREDGWKCKKMVERRTDIDCGGEE